MTVLASGSKGNATVIAAGSTRILVDAGMSCRELMKRMAQVGEDPEALDAILITHEHLDHVAGLSVLARRLKIPVFFTESTHRAWVRMLTPRTTMTYAKWLETVQREKASGLTMRRLQTALMIGDCANPMSQRSDEHEAPESRVEESPKRPRSRLIPRSCRQWSTSAPGMDFRLARLTSTPSPFRMMRPIPAGLSSTRGRSRSGWRLPPISAMCRRM